MDDEFISLAEAWARVAERIAQMIRQSGGDGYEEALRELRSLADEMEDYWR